MSIRETVFVQSQSVPLENELDADDPRAWHWVVYASVGVPKGGRGEGDQSARRGSGPGSGSISGRVPVGTLRLVPPPHPPHPAPGSHHAIDNAEGGAPPPAAAQQSPTPTAALAPARLHASTEPYVKLGRLATLPDYRGLGLGRLLVNTALEWVGRNAERVSGGGGDPVAREREGGEDGWRGLVLVHAQVGVRGFWEGLGFVQYVGLGEWWEEGIRHVGMWRRVEVRGGR